MNKVKIFTIGFTKTTAESFFGTLHDAGVKQVIDVRLNNVSQLAGFAKRDDLKYFLRELHGIGYVHTPILAPTSKILNAYKKERGTWSEFERQFLELMRVRHIENVIAQDTINVSCLLCSEDKPDYCHRRLVLEYLMGQWGAFEVEHLLPSRWCPH